MREKIAAYLNAGAEEVWLVHESGRTQFFDRSGETSVTRFGLRLDPPPPAARR
jgi:hypothetical protein